VKSELRRPSAGEEDDLSPAEFQVACNACRAIRVAGSPPAYVQALLAHVLATLEPGLADKVARLRPAQMEALRDRIGRRQESGFARMERHD
jgi:hypothetical protein